MKKSKPNKVNLCLLDADVIAYRSAFATNKPEDTEQDTRDTVDGLVDWILEQCGIAFVTKDNFKGYLTGKDNFRFQIAKTHEYKGNRKDVPRPTNLPVARKHLIDKWGCVVVDGAEADDAIATETASRGYPDDLVMVSVDKDFQTIPGWTYNFVKNTWNYQTEWEALKYFYEQILTGDSADNIKGIHRVGPKKAQKILENARYGKETDLYNCVLAAYEEDILKSAEGKVATQDFWYTTKAVERVLENARLLHLQRYKGELWEPPK